MKMKTFQLTPKLNQTRGTKVRINFSIWSPSVEQVYLGYNHNKSQQSWCMTCLYSKEGGRKEIFCLNVSPVSVRNFLEKCIVAVVFLKQTKRFPRIPGSKRTFKINKKNLFQRQSETKTRSVMQVAQLRKSFIKKKMLRLIFHSTLVCSNNAVECTGIGRKNETDYNICSTFTSYFGHAVYASCLQ